MTAPAIVAVVASVYVAGWLLAIAFCRSAATYSNDFDSTVFPRTVVDPRPGTPNPVGLNSTVGGGGTTGSPAPVVDGGVPATQADVPGPAPDNTNERKQR